MPIALTGLGLPMAPIGTAASGLRLPTPAGAGQAARDEAQPEAATAAPGQTHTRRLRLRQPAPVKPGAIGIDGAPTPPGRHRLRRQDADRRNSPTEPALSIRIGAAA